MTKKTTSLTEIFSKTFQEETTLDFDAQVLAALMLQSNALVSIKMATRLCSISRQEIDRRIHAGTFPEPIKLSGDEKAIRKAFKIKDIAAWVKNPAEYFTSGGKQRVKPVNKVL